MSEDKKNTAQTILPELPEGIKIALVIYENEKGKLRMEVAPTEVSMAKVETMATFAVSNIQADKVARLVGQHVVRLMMEAQAQSEAAVVRPTVMDIKDIKDIKDQT